MTLWRCDCCTISKSFDCGEYPADWASVHYIQNGQKVRVRHLCKNCFDYSVDLVHLREKKNEANSPSNR